MCTDTVHIPYLSLKIFNVTHAITIVFNVTSEKEIIIIKKNNTTLKSKDRLGHCKGGGYIYETRLYTSLKYTIKTYFKGEKPEGNISTKLEGVAATTENSEIKIGETGEM